ncbi:MAG: cation:proton antiporter [Dehalococcoidia bacterium]|nr:cation:proton antiporter [Dehalococcoidia bacterium]
MAILSALENGDSGLLRDFAIIMAVAGGALVLCRQTRLSPVLGYLVAGVIIGPSVLRTVENPDTIGLLADLGLILLLFGVGLELGWQRIRGVGARVVLIALVEMSIMFALGFEVAILMGWSDGEAVFLGAALTISSTAILMTMLRESGQLLHARGRLIVGILVVEDFVAVVLLTVLTGVATTGTANPQDIGLLAAKLAIFGAVALVFGALFAPRLIHFVNRFHSDETLLITGLALCFGLALAAQQLGLSAAAGAFLIGAVLGDSHHAEQLDRIMSPVRDMFAALFFVAIGMLIDLSEAVDVIVPTIVVAVVFIAGKLVSDTIGTLLVGHGGRISLGVGLGMPQLGEFSLAMIRTGVVSGTVGAFMYPVMTGATAITALIYPFLFRSTDVIADFIDRRSPRLMKQYGESLVLSLATLRTAFRFRSRRARRIQRSGRLILLDLGIIIVIIAIGTGILRFTPQLSSLIHIRESLLGLVIGGSVLALCIPPAVGIWRSLRTLTEGIADYVLPSHMRTSDAWGGGNLRVVLRDTILILVLILPAIWSVPFISHLLSLGSLSTPLPIVLLVGLGAGLAGATFQIHHVLVRMFSRTFLGMDDPFSLEDMEHRYLDDDVYVYTDDGTEPDELQDSEADPAAAQERSGD